LHNEEFRDLRDHGSSNIAKAVESGSLQLGCRDNECINLFLKIIGKRTLGIPGDGIVTRKWKVSSENGRWMENICGAEPSRFAAREN
jgi:hypothetical protein